MTEPVASPARATPCAMDEGRLGAEANLGRDEELLAEGAPFARVAVLADRAVSLGAAQDPDGPTGRRARELGLRVLRRRSGGTGLLHLPGDVVWSIVLPRTDPRAGRGFIEGYATLGTGVVRALREHGLDATWSPPIGSSSEYCLLSGRGRVLTVGGRALGGAAQHLTSGALLHHGVVTSSLDRGLLAAVFALSDEAISRQLTSLDALGLGPSAPDLARSIVRHLVAT